MVEIVGGLCIRGVGVTLPRQDGIVSKNKVFGPNVTAWIQQMPTVRRGYRGRTAILVAVLTDVEAIRVGVDAGLIVAHWDKVLDLRDAEALVSARREVRFVAKTEGAGETELPA